MSAVLQENLVAKCKGLTASGMTCHHWCGGYAVPAPTATGSIQRDMCLIDSCLGVGEVAVSDHRSSVPSVNHLANIARYVAVQDQSQTISLSAKTQQKCISSCPAQWIADAASLNCAK